MTMTRAEFAERWDSDDEGGGITMNEVADCAQAWGLYSTPRTHPMSTVLEAVVQASGAIT